MRMRESPRAATAADEPCCPVGSATDRAVLAAYREIAGPDVLCGGRPGTHQYLDMHTAVASAPTPVDTALVPWAAGGAPFDG